MYKEDLELLDEEHDPSKVVWSEKVPDGDYQARLDSARVTRAKTSERLQTVFDFEIVHGEHEGRTVTKYCGMETKENLDFLTRDIWRILGKQVSFKWKDIEDIFEEMLDTIVQIRVKTDKKSGIQNIFIQGKIAKENSQKEEELPF